MMSDFLAMTLGRAAHMFVKLAWRYEVARILRKCDATGKVKIRMPMTIYDPEKVVMGDRVSIGEYVHIRGGGGLTIGNRVAIAAHAVITTQGHPIDLPRFADGKPILVEAAVVLEDDVWIGSGAVILPGVRVGCGSIVAAGAVVTHDVPAYTVAAGVPARVIREIARPAEAK